MKIMSDLLPLSKLADAVINKGKQLPSLSEATDIIDKVFTTKEEEKEDKMMINTYTPNTYTYYTPNYSGSYFDNSTTTLPITVTGGYYIQDISTGQWSIAGSIPAGPFIVAGEPIKAKEE